MINQSNLHAVTDGLTDLAVAVGKCTNERSDNENIRHADRLADFLDDMADHIKKMLGAANPNEGQYFENAIDQIVKMGIFQGITIGSDGQNVWSSMAYKLVEGIKSKLPPPPTQ